MILHNSLTIYKLSACSSRWQTGCPVGLHHIYCHCGEGHTLSYALRCRWTVAIQLSCTSKFRIPAVNPVYYDNMQSNCHFENTAEMNFFWIKSKITLLLLRASFSHSVLMLGFWSLFLTVPDPVANYSINSDRIPYELSHLQFKNLHHDCHWVLHQDPYHQERVVERKLVLGFQLNEALDV